MTSSAETSDRRFHCLICGEVARGLNSSVESCRACSAFFRRSVLAKKQYTCLSYQNCDVKRGGKRTCRKCRIRRCLEIGMAPELVNSTINRTRGLSESAIVEKNLTPLINKIKSLYHLSRSRRFYSELSLLPATAKHPRNIDPINAQQLHSCDIELTEKLWIANQKFIAEFCTDSFDEFAALGNAEKFALFRSFFTTLFMFELEEATALYMLEKESKRQVSRTTYIDFARSELYWNNRAANADEEFLKNWRGSPENHVYTRFLASIRQLKICEIERAAIVGLLIWNVDDLDLFNTEETLSLCAEMRSRIMRELHVYYNEILHKDMYCTRLGKILDFYHQILAHVRGMRTSIIVYTMSGLMKQDSMLFELFRV